MTGTAGLSGTALIFCLVGLISTAEAQVELLVPEAKTMRAPDWVKPGTRITWHMMYASRQGKFAKLDPDGGYKTEDGTRVNLKDGGATSGQGYLEVWIVAVEPGRVVCEIRTYSLGGTKPSGPGSLTASNGAVSTTPGVFADYWIHPKALEAALARQGPGSPFLIVDTKHNNRDAVMIADPRSATSSLSRIYDRTSGVLLSLCKSNQGKKGIGGTGPDGATYGGAKWSASVARFMQYKAIKLPWLGQPKPKWVVGGHTWEFDGSYRSAAVGRTLSVPISQRLRATSVGKTWALFERTIANGPRHMLDRGGMINGLPVTPSKSQLVCGDGSPAGFWIPPAAIAKLTKGQTICKSEITRFQATVIHVGPHQGNDTCVIRWQNPLQSHDFVYDRKSGGLLSVILRDTGFRTETEFVFAASK